MVSRSEDFQSRQPFQLGGSLQKSPSQVSGPFPWINPTRAHFHQETDERKNIPRHDVFFSWSSRDNRKGRHALWLTKSGEEDSSFATPKPTSAPREIAKGSLRMITVYPYYDVSYLVAIVFTFGSVVWVINAFFTFLPFLVPSTEFNGESLDGGGITAFVGATIFEVGSILLMLEAINEHHEGCFGWAVEEVIEDGSFRISRSDCRHHHANKNNLVGQGADVKPWEISPDKRTWSWCPSWSEVRTHYIHELGFLACFSQLIGATVFWISGFTALPGIFNHLSPELAAGIYWTPQVLGGCGFIISGTLFMLETQQKWYLPAFGVLGWHIGLWNLIGGIGFTLCPIFGYSTKTWAEYQAGCSTFWGSWAFLIGSVIQWYESLDKYPVSVSG